MLTKIWDKDKRIESLLKINFILYFTLVFILLLIENIFKLSEEVFTYSIIGISIIPGVFFLILVSLFIYWIFKNIKGFIITIIFLLAILFIIFILYKTFELLTSSNIILGILIGFLFAGIVLKKTQ